MFPLQFNELWSFNTLTDQWQLSIVNNQTFGNNIVTARYFHTLVSTQGTSLFLFGGSTTEWSQTTPLSDLYLLTPITPGSAFAVMVFPLPSLPGLGVSIAPPGRSAHTAFAWDPANMMVVMMGFSQVTPSQPFAFGTMSYSNDVFAFRYLSPNQMSEGIWQQINITGVLPPPRAGHVGEMLRGETDHPVVFVFGGITVGQVLLEDMWMLTMSSDLNAWTWQQLHVAGGPGGSFIPIHHRLGHDKMVVYGGLTQNSSEAVSVM